MTTDQATRSTRPGLTPAERARTVVASAASLDIGVLNLQNPVERHAVDGDGSVLFLPPAGSPERHFAVTRRLATPRLTAVARDLAPVACADRVRATVLLTGHLSPFDPAEARGQLAALVRHLTGHPDPGEWNAERQPILRLRPEVVQMLPGSVAVPAEEYAASAPDPLTGYETQWLPHLARDHAEVLIALATAHDPSLESIALSPYAVTPYALDRFGLVLRVRLPDGSTRDLRLDFPRPARCGCDVPPAFNDLLRSTLPPGSPVETCE